MEKLEFPIYKSKVISLAVACVFLLVSCLYILLSEEDVSPLMQAILGVGSIVAVVEFIRLVIVLKDNNKILIITEDGIYCNMTNPAISVQWSEIEKLDMVRRNSRKHLAIYVKDPKSYLQKYNSKTFVNNYNYANTPFLINTAILKVEAEELVNRINKELSTE